MRVFLAGKMDHEHGSWRDGILNKRFCATHKGWHPGWEAVQPGDPGDQYDSGGFLGFPTGANLAVLGLHQYVGPYRMTWEQEPRSNKSSGYFHGSTLYGQHGMADETGMNGLVSACLRAISMADLVFAFINTDDAYGTLAEIGYARSLGKYIYLVFDEQCDVHPVMGEQEPWYFHMLATHVGTPYSIWHGETPPTDPKERARTYFRDALVQWTARPADVSSVQILSSSSTAMQSMGPDSSVFREIYHSFSQIANWSADPRVRNEAHRMLRSLRA